MSMEIMILIINNNDKEKEKERDNDSDNDNDNDNDNDYDVVFIKRTFQNGTNIPYGYLTFAHKRGSEYTRDIRAKGKPIYCMVHNMK